MAALYDVFRTPQLKGETKVHYHARSMVTGKKSTRDLIQDITRQSAFKEGVVTGVLIALGEALRAPFYFPVPGNYGVSRERPIE